MTPVSLSDLSNTQIGMIPKAQRAKLGKAAVTSEEAQAKGAAKLEKQIQQTIRQWLDLKGWFYCWQRMDKRARGKAGQPDFVVCVPRGGAVASGAPAKRGVFVAIECKMPGGTVSAEQHEALALIAWHGGLSMVATSAQEAIDFLRGISS
jgi:hypothetical protein